MSDKRPISAYACSQWLHVEDMAASIHFYEALDAARLFVSRDGDWALLRFGRAALSLLAHPPGDSNLRVELQFTSACRLDEIEAHMTALNPALIDRGAADEAFGRMSKLRKPDGLLIKILELERDLIE